MNVRFSGNFPISVFVSILNEAWKLNASVHYHIVGPPDFWFFFTGFICIRSTYEIFRSNINGNSHILKFSKNDQISWHVTIFSWYFSKDSSKSPENRRPLKSPYKQAFPRRKILSSLIESIVSALKRLTKLFPWIHSTNNKICNPNIQTHSQKNKNMIQLTCYGHWIMSVYPCGPWW